MYTLDETTISNYNEIVRYRYSNKSALLRVGVFTIKNKHVTVRSGHAESPANGLFGDITQAQVTQ